MQSLACAFDPFTEATMAGRKYGTGSDSDREQRTLKSRLDMRFKDRVLHSSQ